MDLSNNKQQEAKKLKVSVNELVMADLMSIGYSEEDAYIIAYPSDAILNEKAQAINRKNVTSKQGFKTLCRNRSAKNACLLAVPSEANEVELIGADIVAKEILMSALAQPTGSKERADLMVKYNDIRRENESVVETSTDSIQFAFPLKCNQCPLLFSYNEFIKENGEHTLRPVEMDAVIRKADKIIKKAMK